MISSIVIGTPRAAASWVVGILTRVSPSTQITPSTAAAPALKEWAAIVHALLEGEQVIDVGCGSGFLHAHH